METEIVNQVQEAHRVPYRISPGRSTLRHTNHINKDLEELKNKHTETNKTIIEIKTTLEGINRRLSEAELISDLEDKMVEITSEEQNKVKE